MFDLVVGIIKQEYFFYINKCCQIERKNIEFTYDGIYYFHSFDVSYIDSDYIS